MSYPSLDALIANVGELGTLPDAWQRVDEVIARPTASNAQISDAISADPALSARLLKLANSPLFGLAQRIDRMSQAVHLIGTRQIRELALATTVIDMVSSGTGSRERIQDYLLRSVGTGLITRGFAARRREANIERFFVVGLLHNIGTLILDLHVADGMAAARTKALAAHEPMEKAEAALFGFDHAAVGAALLSRWKLPSTLIEPVAFHHLPYQAPTQRVEAAAVHVASIATDLLAPGVIATTPIDPRAWELLAIDADLLGDVTAEADVQARVMLGSLAGSG